MQLNFENLDPNSINIQRSAFRHYVVHHEMWLTTACFAAYFNYIWLKFRPNIHFITRNHVCQGHWRNMNPNVRARRFKYKTGLFFVTSMLHGIFLMAWKITNNSWELV